MTAKPSKTAEWSENVRPRDGARRVRFALDQNFPDPVVARFADLLPGVELVPVRAIDPSFAELDDWQLFVELERHALGWDGLVTCDKRLLALEKEMVVFSQIRLTLVVVEGEGGNPVKAVGLLLAHLSHIAHQSDPRRAQVWRLRQKMRDEELPVTFLDLLAKRAATTVTALVAKHAIAPGELAAPRTGPR